MNIATIRQKLADYLCYADDKKIKAIYTMLEEEIDQSYDRWKDKAFVKEMDKRMADMGSGKVQGRTWDEVKIAARQSVKPHR